MPTPRRSAPRLLAVLVAVLVAVLLPVLGSQSASAVGGRCAPGDGVTVVVDYGDKRGGIDLFCDRAGGGKTVSQVMSGAGVDWQYTSGQPFVCRIEGIPTQEQGEDCVDTPPPDAYWGLFWSDGSPQAWAYSTRGAASLRVPNGGSVGWRFQDGGDRDVPGAAPTARPSPKPEPSPAAGGSGGGAGPDAGGAASPEPTRAPASRAPGGDMSDAPSAGHAATAAKPSKNTAANRTKRVQDVRQRPGKDRAEGRTDRAADPSRAAESADATEVTSAGSELVQPVSGEGGGGSSTGDALLLVAAALAAVGLAAVGVVTARRRRT